LREMKWYLLAAVVLLSAACKEEETGGDIVWEAHGASADQIADLQKGCDQWNAVANRQQYVAGPRAAGTHYVRFVPRNEIPHEPKPGGLYDPDSRTIYISTGLIERRLMALLHEQGHALGLDHSEEGIMAKHGMPATEPVDLTRGDLEECHRAGACSQ
jgi:hypothetical protein